MVPVALSMAYNSAACRLFYAASNGKWRTDEGASLGTDNDGAVQHILVLNSNVYFTDGVYSGATGTDAATGFGFMKWTTYMPTVVARLIIED